MAGHSIEVTYEAPDPTRIPDALSEGAAFFVDLEHRGVLSAVDGCDSDPLVVSAAGMRARGGARRRVEW